MSEKSIMILTQDVNTDVLLHDVALRNNYTAMSVHNMHQIQSAYADFKPGLVILDLDFGELDGVMLVNYLVNIQCKTPTIIIGFEDERLLLAVKHVAEVKGITIFGMLRKPLQEKKIDQILKSFDKRVSERIDASKLAKALENNHFEMYYQPKIHIKTKQLRGFEALVRWKQPNGDMIPAMAFIPIAEESGLIVPLTHWIIRRVFEDYGKFKQDKGVVRFAINLSPKILNDIVFPDEIFKLAKEYAVDPASICFEITESGVSHQSELILEVLTRLRIFGFSLSIDDFGTGYSSIAELQRLPFNELKVDQRFVIDLADNPATQTIVRSTIELGHNLGMELVAEGVESVEAMQMLENLECDISQGYLLSEPLSIPDLNLWYAQHIDKNLKWRRKLE